MTTPNPFDRMQQAIAGTDAIHQIQREAGLRARAAAEAQIALPNLLSGFATWDAMKSAMEQLRRIAPKDHDVVIKVSDVTVIEAYFIEPHAFLFQGVNDVGEDTWIGLHFSQLVFAVIHRQKFRPEPTITGFCPHAPSV